jgi:5-methylcytosine-specific restriction endonuclease McrA
MGVVVLNASYEPHQTVSVPHAVRMLVRKVAVVEESDGERVIGPYPWPKVVRLVRYVYARWIVSTDRFTRIGMLRRDKYTCRYCRSYGDTMDHVIPESRGGLTNWLNCVTACETCNSDKANRTPKEARMPLLWEPYVPRPKS